MGNLIALTYFCNPSNPSLGPVRAWKDRIYLQVFPNFFDKKISLSPKKTEIVVFDLQFDLSKIFSNKRVEFFDPRYRNISLLPLILAILSKSFSTGKHSLTHHYFLIFLFFAKPKFVLTTVDNNENFYSVRDAYFLRDSRFVAIQNGCRWIQTIPGSVKKLRRGDQIHCLTKWDVAGWQAMAPEATVLASGTVWSKLAFQACPGRNAERLVAGFISTWKPGEIVDGIRLKATVDGSRIKHSKFYSPEIQNLPHLKVALDKLGVELEIIPRSLNENDAQAEKEFYESILGLSGWKFGSGCGSKYENLARYRLLFVVTSTLAYEALALGLPVLFLEVLDEARPFRQNFCYPGFPGEAESLLLLENGHFDAWYLKIRLILDISSKKLEELCAAVVGEMARKMGPEEISKCIFET